ncbi:MAG: GH32 C-terminal domain-containing protein, partial [Oscillospiraceae bacterium]|nr:GH32 C-terminal domain-containing protein [Oscillospiraceae bacterium]
KAVLDKCSDIRIISDTSSLEIYLDGGRTVLGTRFYPDNERVTVSAEGISAEIFSLREMEVKYLGE